jgi:N-acylneuraminate cytidylyltransferase/CMP-N,N'-diacetyllegionaminic acid synthase
MKKEILAVIPARGGSKGLPGKNIRLLNGKPLIAYSIEAAFQSKYITRVIVATDSEEIAEVAKKYNAEVPFLRPAKISGDTSHMFLVYKYVASWLLKNENYQADIQCNLLPTTPLRDHTDIDKAMKLMIDTDCDWCFSVNEMEHHPYRAMQILDDTRMKAFFDIPREILWANRQELPPVVRFNGGIMAGKTQHILSFDEYNIDNLEFSSTDVRYIKMNQKKSYDIDTVDDFNYIEYLLKKENN